MMPTVNIFFENEFGKGRATGSRHWEIQGRVVIELKPMCVN
jgi:hypothetical protein